MTELSTLETKQRQTMRLLRDYVDRLPVTAAAANVIRRIPSAGNTLPDEVLRLAALDPTLAVRMLYLANHTFLGGHGMPVTIGAVMARVGADRVLEGLTSMHRSHVFQPTGTEVGELWTHSIQVALLARLFVGHMPELGIQLDEAYLAGLLHDVGRFIMLISSPDKYASIADREWRNGDDLLTTETEVCGYTHDVLGWLACRTWNFPEHIAIVNRYHHHWTVNHDEQMSKRTRILVRLVGLADELSFAAENDKASEVELAQMLRSAEDFWLEHESMTVRFGEVAEVTNALKSATAASHRVFAPALESEV